MLSSPERGLSGHPLGGRLAPAGQCEVCRSWSGAALCGECIACFAAPVTRCARCGLALATAQAVCGECLRDPPPYQACVCAVDYAFPWDALIARFKFNGQVELAQVLALQLHRAVQHSAHPLPEWLVPVPLSTARLAERGYNQAWQLARQLANRLSIAASAALLQRPVDTAHQADLPLRERRSNLRGAFFIDPRQQARIVQRHVALIDDVMTSGATLREATTTLLRAGARRVDVWVLARTPAPRR
ncbi:MAG: ComF family protein [Rubrivivax sp.]